MDIGIIGAIIFVCGAAFHEFELTVAGSLIWAYGVLLLLAEEYRKGKEESRRDKKLKKEEIKIWRFKWSWFTESETLLLVVIL